MWKELQLEGSQALDEKAATEAVQAPGTAPTQLEPSLDCVFQQCKNPNSPEWHPDQIIRALLLKLQRDFVQSKERKEVLPPQPNSDARLPQDETKLRLGKPE